MWRTLNVSTFPQPRCLVLEAGPFGSRKRVLDVFDTRSTCGFDSQSEASMLCTLQDTGKGSCRDPNLSSETAEDLSS